MKKIKMIFIVVLVVTGLATSAFAFGPDGHEWRGNYRDGRYEQRRFEHHEGYDRYGNQGRGWAWGHYKQQAYPQQSFQYAPYREARMPAPPPQPNGHYAPYRSSGVSISLPLVPIPGISHMFPSIHFSID